MFVEVFLPPLVHVLPGVDGDTEPAPGPLTTLLEVTLVVMLGDASGDAEGLLEVFECIESGDRRRCWWCWLSEFEPWLTMTLLFR